MSGPIMASVWLYIHTPTGMVTLDYPQGIVGTANETQIRLSVSQGTWMKAAWTTLPATEKKGFNLSGE